MPSTTASSLAPARDSSSLAPPPSPKPPSQPSGSATPTLASPPSLLSARSSIRGQNTISILEPPSRQSQTPSLALGSELRPPPSVRLSSFSFRSSPSSSWGEWSSNPSARSSTLTLASVNSFRSSSSDSPMYMFKNPIKSVKQLPYEEPSLSDADFELFAKLSREQQQLNSPGVARRSIFKVFYLLILLSIIYFLLIGYPLWPGAVLHCWHFFHEEKFQKHIYGLISFVSAGTLRNILPLFTKFDASDPASDPEKPRDASECCIVIPCYKSAETLRSTLPACLAIFNPEQIYVVANGNSMTPLDHTADVCAEYGVRHIWVPVGSKITAEFVGVALATQYKYVMLIDDDVILPSNMPLPTHYFEDCAPSNKVACVGYTIKSVGANSEPGTIVQQVQDIEYKIAGLTKVFQSHYGSVTFPHGAVALWRRDILMQIFHAHPGYHISEDWYLGHTARAAGYRIVMNSQVFVETETPPRLFPAIFSKQTGSRAGYGEMSIYKQRFYRWNFFFLFRIWSNTIYLIFSWRLGWREFVTKIWVFGECFDSLIMLLAPIMLPIALAASWHLFVSVSAGLLVFNFLLVCIFNLVQLGWLRKGCATDERIAWKAFLPYMFLKFILVYVNVASVYWSIYEYARFFSKQNLRVTESVAAWQVIRQHMQPNPGSAPGAQTPNLSSPKPSPPSSSPLATEL